MRQFEFSGLIRICICISMLAILCSESTLAQRPRFNPDPPVSVTSPTTQQTPVNQWRTAVAPRPFIQNSGISAPPMQFNQQPTGPFATPGSGIVVGPGYGSSVGVDPYAGQAPGFSSIPTGQQFPPYMNTPQANPGVIVGNPPPGAQMYPTYPQYGTYQPIYQPDGTMMQSNVLSWPSDMWSRAEAAGIPKLFEHPRVRYTLLDGTTGDDLQIHDLELATTILIPNFLYTCEPLRISPGFTFHWWDGPETAATGVDLPAQAYSAFGAFDYQTPWDRQLGAEVNFTIGVYSDFDNVNSDSIRLTGVGLGRFRITNNMTFKAGVEYLDRLDVKIIPAVGIFLMPSPDTRLDIYFPRPKLARRIPSYGNFEVWAYVGGEYGGGSWTIERMGGVNDQVDINDMRVFAGFEWMGPKCVTGFFEAGYVFERELVFSTVANPIQIGDTYMLRTGFAF